MKARGLAIAAGVGAAFAIAIAVVVVWLAREDSAPVADPIAPPVPPPVPVMPRLELPLAAPDAGVLGAESIRGRVVTVDGKPVAGVQVVVERDAGTSRAATTDADGRYEVTGLGRGVHRLRVEGPGVIPAELRRVVAPDVDVDVVVARSTRIEGLVFDGAFPVEGATVELAGTALTAPREVATDAGGAFSLEVPEGTFALTARKEARAASTKVERFGAGPWEPVVLFLAPAALVRGRVTDVTTGDPIAGARVVLVSDAVGAAPRRATSGLDGRWSIEGVTAGPWSLDADAPGYLSAVPQPVEATEGMNVDLAVVLFRGGVVEGRVIDARGGAIVGARVELRGETQAGRRVAISAEERARRLGRQRLSSASAPSARLVPVGELGVLLGPIPYPPPPGAAVAAPSGSEPPDEIAEVARGFTTDADGRFRIDAVPPGRFVVSAVQPEFATGESEAIAIDGAEVESTVVALRRGAIVEGTVTDGFGIGIPNAEVSARAAGRTVAFAFTDDTGRYRLSRLSGELRLRAAARGHAPVEEPLELGIDDEGRTIDRRFVLGAARNEIAGIVVDSRRRPVAGVEVTAEGAADVRARASSGADGRFVLRGLPDGVHRVEARHPEFATVSRAGVRAGEDRLELTLTPAGGIEGEVRDAHTGGPMLSFSIRARGPNGEELAKSFEKGDFTLVPLAPGTWTLTVEARGFATRTVRYDVPSAREPREPSLRDVQIQLRQGGTVAGAVYDSHGEPASGALVVASNTRATTDHLGRFRLTGVEPGDFPVRATHPSLGTGETPVALRSGDEILTLEIKLGTLSDL